ncbi:hypothetical protein EV426DRAFT_615792 [Tirmania nivea]|nr:hypothetical protein EV426DRAFT_615792 [Tirmania nivea]
MCTRPFNVEVSTLGVSIFMPSPTPPLFLLMSSMLEISSLVSLIFIFSFYITSSYAPAIGIHIPARSMFIS